jgi:DNA-directed RNA polymerase subunit E'/Rpb7
MSRITVERKIYLEPKLLDTKVSTHIRDKIQKQLMNNCDKEYGYIIKVYENITILGNIVSSVDSGVYFHVRFSLKTLKPKIGNTYEGNVFLVCPDLIFVEVANKMKIMIRDDKMNGYKYSKTKNIYKKDTKTITEGDKVQIVIDMIKYEKQNFNCIGSLKTL